MLAAVSVGVPLIVAVVEPTILNPFGSDEDVKIAPNDVVVIITGVIGVPISIFDTF